MLTSSLDELGDARAWMAAHARAAGFDERTVLDLELVITEAVSNVIRHAYDLEPGHAIELDAEDDGEFLRITIFDRGAPMGAPPLQPREDGGYGLGLIAQLVDSTYRSTGGDGNTLELVKRRPGGQQ